MLATAQASLFLRRGMCKTLPVTNPFFVLLRQGGLIHILPRTCASDVASGNLNKFTATSCQPSFDEKKQRFQRRCSRLQTLSRRIPWSPITHFSAFGKLHALPYKTSDTNTLKTPSEEELDYLAGFLDGDGCVTPKGESSCVLSVKQPFDRGEALLLF
eukprot:TRINITY_DN3404_c0_g1_i1.p2 TRINITY_DN3404_c0_g1~~TRINITY_DN3404_c0_g1_i1.p2  ORF type:complete len:158 (+),score=23.07 TRINITY_DN3404_c0_g1_i1:352-825(+)